MFVQNFIKLSSSVYELSCWQGDDAEPENNTEVASAGSDNNH